MRLGVVDIGIEKAALPNGVMLDLAIVRHPGASAVVAIDERGRVVMLRQFRYAIKRYIWEIPAGCRNGAERSLACARRELLEEAGLVGNRWNHLGGIVTIPSFCDERIELFLARDLSKGKVNLDADEVIRVVRLPLSKALKMIERGAIIDAKTIAALHLARDVLRKPGQ